MNYDIYTLDIKTVSKLCQGTNHYHLVWLYDVYVSIRVIDLCIDRYYKSMHRLIQHIYASIDVIDPLQ